MQRQTIEWYPSRDEAEAAEEAAIKAERPLYNSKHSRHRVIPPGSPVPAPVLVGGRSGPIYERIAQYFAAEVKAGRLAAGGRLPNLTKIAADFDASMGTVTRALDLLRRMGLVQTTPGRGSFVIASEPRPAARQSGGMTEAERAIIAARVAELQGRIEDLECNIVKVIALRAARAAANAPPVMAQAALPGM